MIDLTRIRVGVINLPHQERRRSRAIAALGAIGLPFEFIEGIRDHPRHLGCSQSHLKAIETLRGAGPFLVLEDDAVPTEHFRPTFTLPETDLLYLGHSPYGYSRHAGGTPELTGSDPTGHLRIHSMLAAHAILYLTDTGAELVAQSIRRSIGDGSSERHDIGLCDLQQSQHVLAVPFPFFVQSAEVQGAAKQARRQQDASFVSEPRKAGDKVGALHVVDNGHGGLAFR